MNTWKLTSFDLFSLGMTIKGAWIYKELPEAEVLQASLDAVLQPYPQLLGSYDETQKSVVWSGCEEPVRLVEIDRRGHTVAEDMYTLVSDSLNRPVSTSLKIRRLRQLRQYAVDGIDLADRL